jgi:predicted alpha/beta superfamily hydrolase
MRGTAAPMGLAFLCACEAGGVLEADAALEADDAAPAFRDAPGYHGSDARRDAGDSFESVLDEISSCDPSRFDRAVHEAAWSVGWPLAGPGRWLFATTLEDRPPVVRVVGDFNGWDHTQSTAVRCPDGSRFYAVLEDGRLARPALGSKFKWYVESDDSYRAPMEATQYGFDEYGRFGWVRAPRDVAHLEQFPSFVSRHLEEPRSFRAYVPAGFEPHSAEARRARTLLLHDGQNVFHPDAAYGGWRIGEALASRGGDVVAIAVDNAADRMDAYTPVSDDLGAGRVGGRAEAYLSLLEEEALPFFRARYGIVGAGPSLMMAGSSLGGLVTLVAVERDLASMGCGAALSSTVGWGSIARTATSGLALVQSWRGHHAPLYLDSGGGVVGSCVDADGDGVDDDAENSDNYCVNVQMLETLTAAGYARDVDLTYIWARGAPHNEASWAGRVGGALDACRAMGWRAP